MQLQLHRRIKLNSAIRERSTKFWETKTWKKLTEKLICLNRCLFLVTQSLLASSSSPSSRRNQTVTSKPATLTERSTHADTTCCSSSTRLYQCRKDFRCQGCDNTKPRPQTHKVSPPRPYTFNHEVGVDVFEIVDSLGTRLSILNAVCMGTTCDQSWIVREFESLGSPWSCIPYMAGRVVPAGLNLFAETEGHTVGVYLARPLPRMV